MRVSEIMTTSVKTAGPDTPIKEIAALMCLHRISGIPIVTGDHTVIGIISEKDIFQRIFNQRRGTEQGASELEEMAYDYQAVSGLQAADIMTREVQTVAPDTSVVKAANMMWWHQFRRFPVVEAGHLVGIVSFGDVHRAVFQNTLVAGR